MESPGQDQAYNGHSIDTSQFYIIFLVSMIFTNNDGISGTHVHVSTISRSRSFQKSLCIPQKHQVSLNIHTLFLHLNLFSLLYLSALIADL